MTVYSACEEAWIRFAIEIEIRADGGQPNVLENYGAQHPRQEAERNEDETEQRHKRNQAQGRRRQNRCAGRTDHQRKHDQEHTADPATRASDECDRPRDGGRDRTTIRGDDDLR